MRLISHRIEITECTFVCVHECFCTYVYQNSNSGIYKKDTYVCSFLKQNGHHHSKFNNTIETQKNLKERSSSKNSQNESENHHLHLLYIKKEKEKKQQLI